MILERTAKKFHFLLFTPVLIILFFEIIRTNTLQNKYFVTHMVRKSGRMKETRTPFYIINPLTVAKNSHKKSRFILDLWDTQFFLFISSEKSSITRELQRKTHVFYKFDVSQGYHHIHIDHNYQKYLGFISKIDGKIIYFMFIVLPFSFSSAPFTFTKVMPCLVKTLEKVRDKKFAYLLTTVLDPPLPYTLIRLST